MKTELSKDTRKWARDEFYEHFPDGRNTSFRIYAEGKRIKFYDVYACREEVTRHFIEHLGNEFGGSRLVKVVSTATLNIYGTYTESVYLLFR